MNRRDFSAAVILATGAGALPLIATAQGATPVEGTQYLKVDPPVPPIAPGKIEVVEFFSYACPHCAAFEPTLEPWAKKLPPDVVLRRVPAPFLMNAENFMRTYYTLETMGKVEDLQLKFFNAIHIEHQRLEKPADIAAFVAKNGVDSAKFLDNFNSFSVATSVTRAKKLAAEYKLDSVPMLTVQGRFKTSPSDAGSAENALAVVDFLVQRARKG